MSTADNPHPNTTVGASKSTTGGIRIVTLVPIALMLFSMFFGAGNLIFPPQLGAQSGENFLPAMIGFLIGGVALPVITIIAIALSGQSVRSLAARGGAIFNVAFSVAVYLSIGAFFGIPRTGAVSFSTAIAPVTGVDSTAASAVFNLFFFGVSYWLARNPTDLVSRLGKILTPSLLILLCVLVVMSLFKLHGATQPPTEQYVETPLVSGLLEGYLTMDSIASLAFGILVISAIRGHNPTPNSDTSRFPVVKATAIAALIAGFLLAVIYVGLGVMGSRIPDGQSFSDGAALLSAASLSTLGTTGQIVFGGIVLLACLTTSVGLLAATSEFFNYLVPKVSYQLWLLVFVLVSFSIASLGLDAVFSIAIPIIVFLYPIAITVVAATLIDAATRKYSMYWGFRVPVWVAVIWSMLTTVAPQAVAWSPGATIQLGWVIPVAIAMVIGIIVDLINPADARKRSTAAAALVREAPLA